MIEFLRAAVSAAALGLGWVAFAQAPFLVRDLNTTWSTSPRSSSPSGFVAMGDSVYFQATLSNVGTEIHKSGPGGTSLLADIVVGPGSADPQQLTALGDDLILFSAVSMQAGRELWATDGTVAGTRLVRDIHPTFPSNPTLFTAAAGKVFLTADDGVHGREPWVSDGTEAGTYLLADLNGASTSSNVQFIAAFGSGQVLIFAGGGMWTSDGTPDGTHPAVAGSTLGSVMGFATVGSTAFFTAVDGAGRELWKTDGTAEGTVRVSDIAPGATSGIHATTHLTALGSSVYFIAGDTGTTYDLWKSDGTAAGTQLVALGIDDVPADGTKRYQGLYDDGATLYLRTGSGLWRSDGSAGGTFVLDPGPGLGVVTPAFNGLYYLKNGADGPGLWATNGTAGTTRLVHRFVDNTSFSTGLFFTGGKLYFSVHDPVWGSEPWVCADGTGESVGMIVNLNPDPPPSSNPIDLTASGDLIYFLASDGGRRQLWRSDGSSGGTIRLTELGDQWNDPRLSLFTGWNGALYFKNWYAELWRSDGTADGTALLKNFSQGYNTPSVSRLFPSSSFLYLTADDGDGPVAWRTDGTFAGTIDLGAAMNYQDQPSYPDSFAELAGRVYIGGGLHYPGIFVSEPSSVSARRVTSVDPGPLVVAAGAIFHSQFSEAEGNELWSSDGTLEGSSLIEDIRPGADSSNPQQLVGSSRYLFFVANDGAHGKELWRSDGTPDGTILLADILPGPASSEPRDLTMAGSHLYFVANDGVSGEELWRSDGTPEGTVQVADLQPGAPSSNVLALSGVDGVLWFSADDGTHGSELWRTTETGGVRMVADLEPGEAGSAPGKAVQAGSLIYFAATTSLGRELWAIAPPSFPALSIGDVRIVEGHAGTKIARFVVTRSGPTGAVSQVTYATADLSATASSDYVAGSGTLIFAADVVTQFIDVVVNGDTAIEKNESFLVSLTGAEGAVLRNVAATGIIDDDDHHADLSLEWSSTDGYGRHYLRITNNGPSVATEVRVTFSESPGKPKFSIRENKLNGRSCSAVDATPLRCVISSLQPGESLTFEATGSGDVGYTDPAEPPGFTVTTEVHADQPDPVPANNAIRRMVRGGLVLPPYLTNGTSSTATYYLPYPSSGVTPLSLGSSVPAVVVSPSTRTVPAGERTADFTVTPQSYVGRVVLRAGGNFGTLYMTIASVQPGTLPKLDVGVVAPRAEAMYGDPLDIALEVAARLHDGTRPTGTITLVGGGQTLQQTLDAKGATTFRRTGLPPGNSVWYAHYSGDANFHALANIPVTVNVRGIPTETSIEIPGYFCGTTDVVFRVRNKATTAVPTGTVTIVVQNQTVATLSLTPSGAAGEAMASMRRTFATNETYVTAAYQPSSTTFASSSDGDHFWSVHCAPFHLVATANGANVSLSWAAQAGAHHYEVLHAINDSSWLNVGSSTLPSYAHVNTSYAPRVLLYAVRAVDAAGNVISYSAPDIVYLKVFSDDPLLPGVTAFKAAHLTELQTAASSLRFLVDYLGVDLPAAVPGAPIRPDRILELRQAINRDRARLGLPAVAFTDPSLTTGGRIKAVHVQELRNAFK